MTVTQETIMERIRLWHKSSTKRHIVDYITNGTDIKPATVRYNLKAMERTGLVKLHHVSDWDSQGKYLEPTNRQHLFGGKGKMKRTMLSVEILPQIDHIEIVSALDRLLRQNGDMDKDLFEGLREWHAIKAL